MFRTSSVWICADGTAFVDDDGDGENNDDDKDGDDDIRGR